MSPRDHLSFATSLTRSSFLRPVPLRSSFTSSCKKSRALLSPLWHPSTRGYARGVLFPRACVPNVPTTQTSESDTSFIGYDFRLFETKWQHIWSERRDFVTPSPPELDLSKPKYYVLDMFPYPSGAGLHVGHPEGYTATDILARFYRKNGYNVLHPMGWDAFGLPAEQYALTTGTHPAITTEQNINRFREQLQALGFSYDWNREVRTTDPSYYKWTQWIFLKLWEKGLAYQDEKPVNWCPALGTVLANEEVIDGLSERGGHPVERRQMKQWVLRITAYAERLLEDLEELDWPESVKDMQRNWIGKSVGAELIFHASCVNGPSIPITVFTTRPETACGVSYVVVAPEYPHIDKLVSDEQRELVMEYVDSAKRKSDRERTGEGAGREKTGVWTGATATNPINGENVPVWVSDFVLGSYGTGAVMAVPAHDARDYAFARTFNLPVKQVIAGGDVDNAPFVGEGPVMQWGNAAGIELDGLPASRAKEVLIDHLQSCGIGTRCVNYKLRDWLFSRQRYWGEPFPIVFVNGNPHPVSELELPVKLPDVSSYKPAGTGESPLAAVSNWVNTTHGVDNASALRETNTMPQWAGSCWYYLRFIDPNNVGSPVDPALERYWMPVDLYVGGVEHAVLHLLYARFWHKVLYDVGVVSTKEPFQRLVNQGMILGEMEHTAFHDLDGTWVSAADVDPLSNRHLHSGALLKSVNVDPADIVKQGDLFVMRANKSVRVLSRAHKMSKSRGNVVNPDAIIQSYGADALRCYLMFMGPLEQVKPWTATGVQGMVRFLARVWRLVIDPSTDQLSSEVTETEPSSTQLKALHQTIKRVTDDVKGLRFNTAIAAMMEYVNQATKWDTRPKEILFPLVSMLSAFAPHISEELWFRMGESQPLAWAPWPKYRAELDVEENKLIVVQVNGKVRGKMEVPNSATKEDVLERAMAEEGVAKYLAGGTIRKQIYVPDKLLNLVVSK